MTPSVYNDKGNFTAYYLPVDTDDSGKAIAPVVPSGSGSGSGACWSQGGKDGALSYTSGMNDLDASIMSMVLI